MRGARKKELCFKNGTISAPERRIVKRAYKYLYQRGGLPWQKVPPQSRSFVAAAELRTSLSPIIDHIAATRS